MLAGALARLPDEENVRGEGFGAKPRTPHPRPGMPHFYGSPRREGYRPRPGPRARLRDTKPSALPRNGPPVAFGNRVPRRYQHGGLESRRPRGSNPRGTRRDAPKGQPMIRRKPRGGQCGGPERSAKETQTPNQSSRAKTDGGRAGKAEEMTRPTVVTVDKSGGEGSGDRSPDPLRGEQAPIGRRWTAKRRSSSRKMGRDEK